MLSDTTYLILALILIGPLLYSPRDEKNAMKKNADKNTSSNSY